VSALLAFAVVVLCLVLALCVTSRREDRR